MTRHIVWDWNGTLINDVHAVVEATNSSLKPFEHPGLSIEEYRRRFRRPLRAFNEEILGIALTDEQWKGVCDRWSVDYRRRVPGCNLYSHTIPALEAVRERGLTQSVLSMWQHQELCALIAKRELSPYFLQVQGALYLESDNLKSRNFIIHLEKMSLNTEVETVVLIGDSLDDADAARYVGTRCILVSGGSVHTPELLAGTGFPVVEDLQEAVALVLGRRLQ